MGETDISGLRLLEAHLRLDWAAEGLDLTSSNPAPPHLHVHTHFPLMFPSLGTGLFLMLLMLSLHTPYLSDGEPFRD